MPGARPDHSDGPRAEDPRRAGRAVGRRPAWRARGAAARASLTAAAAAIVLLAPPAARAASSEDGPIAFETVFGLSTSLQTVNPDGSNLLTIPNVPPDSENPAWSPGGTQLAFDSPVAGRDQIFEINADGTGLKQVTNGNVPAIEPSWSPTGDEIVFSRVHNGIANIYVRNLNAPPNVFTRLTKAPEIDEEPQFSPDGSLIAFTSNRTGSFEIDTMMANGANQQQLTTQTGDNTDPAWGPMGAELAYTNTVAGVSTVYAMDQDGSDLRQLTSGEGAHPAWSPTGDEIAFTRDGGIWTVSSIGEPAGARATEVAPAGLYPTWAAVEPPDPTAAAVAGTVLATTPGSSTPVPLTGTTPLMTGTQVDASQGTAQVTFKPRVVALTAPPSTALIRHLAFTVLRKTVGDLSLQITSVCARHATALTAVSIAGRPPSRYPSRVSVHRGHMSFNIPGQGYLDSIGTTYTFGYSCQGTELAVQSGTVLVTLNHGRRRHQQVTAGGKLFIPAG